MANRKENTNVNADMLRRHVVKEKEDGVDSSTHVFHVGDLHRFGLTSLLIF